MENKLRQIFKDYAELKITFEVFEHGVQSVLKFSKKKNDLENSFTIDCLPPSHTQNFSINISTLTIVNVLKRYLEGEINLKELENWANVLVMDDDHFIIGEDELSSKRESAYDALHQIGSWPENVSRQTVETYISKIENGR